MAQADDDAAIAELSELIEARLAPGFLGRADIEADVCDWLESSGLGSASARDLVETMWLRHLADQEAWDQPGDHERLNRAFADLAASGYLTRMYFGCCRACAAEAIMAEREPRHWAFVYFDEESASELAGSPGLLALSFGAFDEASAADVGGPVVEAVGRHGLDVVAYAPGRGELLIRSDRWRKRLPGT